MRKITSIMLFAALLCSAFVSQVLGQFGSTDFLIADTAGGRIAVYDQSFVFLRYLDTGFNQVSGLTIPTAGTLAAAGRSPARIKVYASDGTVTSDFTDTNIGTVRDLKAYNVNRLLVGSRSTTSAVAEFTIGGAFLGSIGSKAYTALAVLPNGVLWANAVPEGVIDVFDIVSGTQTGTITLDNGQVNVGSMYYSASTNTVLMTDSGTNVVFERTTSGAFVRQFTGGGAGLGVTRGPGGDVYAVDQLGTTVYRWNSTGTLLGSIDISTNVSGGSNIIWAGAQAPTAAPVSISGRVLAADGRPISRATVTVTDSAGVARSALSNNFGNFRLPDVPSGETYVVSLRAKGYVFAPRTISVADSVSDLTLTAEPRSQQLDLLRRISSKGQR